MLFKRGTIPTFFRVGLVLLCALIVSPTFAQKDKNVSIPLDHFYADPEGSNLRNFLSKLHFSLSIGYGQTMYRQDLSNYSILQQPGTAPVIFPNTESLPDSVSGFDYWFNTVNPTTRNYNSTTDFVARGDSVNLKYKATGWSIPLNLTIHYEFDRYKIGGGMIFEFHSPGDFRPMVLEDTLGSYSPNFGSTFYKKYFVMAGAKVYRYYNYVVSADAHIGAFSLSRKFDKELITKGIYLNLGVTIERELSEYVRAFVRPSYDIKSYTLNVPSAPSIKTNMNAWSVGVGVTYRIPRLRRCFIKECRTQVDHQHGNREYRSRVHPWYKKQNPHHGENYPTLIKYKGKNKKKMNPY